MVSAFSVANIWERSYCSAAVPGVWDSTTPVLVLRVWMTTEPVDGSNDWVGLEYTTAVAVVVLSGGDSVGAAAGALAADGAANVGAMVAWPLTALMLIAPILPYAATDIDEVVDRLKAEYDCTAV